MLYKATVSFSGVVSMAMGEVREISDSSIADDLLRAGHIIPFEADNKPEEKPKAKPKAKKTTKGKEKADED